MIRFCRSTTIHSWTAGRLIATRFVALLTKSHLNLHASPSADDGVNDGSRLYLGNQMRRSLPIFCCLSQNFARCSAHVSKRVSMNLETLSPKKNVFSAKSYFFGVGFLIYWSRDLGTLRSLYRSPARNKKKAAPFSIRVIWKSIRFALIFSA